MLSIKENLDNLILKHPRINPFGLDDYIQSNISNDINTIDNLESILIYYSMILIRKFEEKCATAYGKKEIWGFCHLYIGQEAVSTGIQYSLQQNDDLITAYRCHGYMIGSGANPLSVIGELMGKEIGSSKGKGGSMHLFNTKNGFFGGHGIVGAQIPMGTGMAFAHKYKNTNGITVALMGDGAANQGQVYESFNMASLWNLPVLYGIENNGYGMGTSCDRACAGDLYKRGEPYGIKGIRVNGMDVNEVISAVSECLDFIRKTQKPLLIEFDTYRYKGHSMSDPALYRSKEEVNEKKNIDPIINYEEKLKHILTTNEIDEMNAFIKNIVDNAYEKAKISSFPDEKSLYDGIF